LGGALVSRLRPGKIKEQLMQNIAERLAKVRKEDKTIALILTAGGNEHNHVAGREK